MFQPWRTEKCKLLTRTFIFIFCLVLHEIKICTSTNSAAGVASNDDNNNRNKSDEISLSNSNVENDEKLLNVGKSTYSQTSIIETGEEPTFDHSVGHKRNKKGENERRGNKKNGQFLENQQQRPVSDGGTDDNSWTLIPFLNPSSQQQSKSKGAKIVDDENDDDAVDVDHEDEEAIDLISIFDPDGYGKGNEEEAEIDIRADGILTSKDYDDASSSQINEKQKQSAAGTNDDPNFDRKEVDDRPNIILILTDDQDIELGSMEYMPETLKAFREQGVEFRHGYVTTPMCCPSRSSILTGLYVHNHQVYTNNDNCSSIQWRENYEKKTFASYLWDSGYYTSYIGKYLNKYDGSHIPYGYDEWNTLLMNSKFYNYTVNRNGIKFRYGQNYKRDYYPNSIANDSINFLQRMAAAAGGRAEVDSQEGSASHDNNSTSFKRNIRQPFLLVASFPSPHGPEDSAPEYKHLFLNTTAHHTPSYNYAPNLDKQWILRVTNKMNPTLTNFTTLLMAKRLQTLQSVDLAVGKIMKLLKDTALDQNTYVFYTSDHGYHVGQFGLVKGKAMPYEFDIRVPFFISMPKRRGAPVPAGGTLIYEPVLNIDLAPTFLELGQLPIPFDMDGRSIVSLIKKYASSSVKFTSNNSSDDDTDTDENNDLNNWTQSFLIESSGRRELFGQIPSLRPTSDSVGAIASTTTAQSILNNLDLVSNKQKEGGDDGRKRFLIDNETTATEIALCQLHPYPCQYGQQKYCRREKNRLRFRKCRQHEDFAGQDAAATFLPSLYSIIPNHYANANNGNGRRRAGNYTTCTCPSRARQIEKRSATLDSQDEHDGSDDDLEIVIGKSAASNSTNSFDWDKQRQMIDDEIEILKLRIEALREKRRDMRRKWITREMIGIESVEEERSRNNSKAKLENPVHFKNQNAFLGSTSSFAPIAPGSSSSKRHNNNKKMAQNRAKHQNNNNADNNVPLPTIASSTNNNTFLSTFNLHPKVTSFLESSSNNNKNQEEREDMIFHHSDEIFYEDEDDDDAGYEQQIPGEAHDVVVLHVHDANLNPRNNHSHRSKNRNGTNNARNKSSERKEFLLPSITTSHNHNYEETMQQRSNSNQQQGGRKKSKGRNKSSSSTTTTTERVGKETEEEVVKIIPIDRNSNANDNEDCECTTISPRWLRQQEKEERKRKKLLSKLRKKQRFLHRIGDPAERHQAESCGTEDKMNCFWHDQSHWRTEPKWTLDSFCFCMNTNNNTYSCLRTINQTHNFLYCHFITGFKMYFDLTQDPYELRNIIGSLPAHEEDWMLAQLFKLKKCEGHQDCWIGNGDKEVVGVNKNADSDESSVAGNKKKNNNNRESKLLEPSIWERIFGRWRKKQRKHRNNVHNMNLNHNNNRRHGRKIQNNIIA